MRKKFYSKSVQGRDLLGEIGVDERITSGWNLEKWGAKFWWRRFILLRIATSGGVL
jgi:hypothetical protein